MTAPEDDAGAKTAAIIARLHQPNVYDRMRAAVRRAQEGETSWTALADGIGRNRLPEFLPTVWRFLPPDQRIVAIGDAWTWAEYPESLLPRDQWLPMFREVGYHDEGKPAKPPDTITLWRGGTVAIRMAWTGSREKGEWFRNRRPDSPGRLWAVTVGSERLLAHYDHAASEDEYVIDPIGIDPVEVIE